MVTISLTDCQDDIISHCFTVRTTVFLQDQGLQVSGLIRPTAQLQRCEDSLHFISVASFAPKSLHTSVPWKDRRWWEKKNKNGAFSWIVLLTHLASTELLRLLSLVPGTQLNSYQANSPDQLLCVMFSFILTQVSVQLFVEIKATCRTCLHNIFRVDKCADLISGNMKFLVWNTKLVRHVDFTANTAWIVTTCGTETGYTVKT